MNRSKSKLREVELSRPRSASCISVSSTSSADKEVQGHPCPTLLQILWKVIQWIVMLTVGTIVLYFQITNWPQSTSIYYTNIPGDNMRGGLAYTCGCSLPSNLQSTDSTNVQASQDKGNLNVCYDTSSLHTVTILMYSNSTVGDELNSFFSVVNVTIEYETVDGYKVSQDAHDLTHNLTTTWLPDDVYDIKSLFLGGYMQPDLHAGLDYLQSAEFDSFPMSYTRLGLHYTCNSCATCDVNKIHKLERDVVDDKELWATCFPWGTARCQSDSASEKYEGKCLFYPTKTLPANFALQRFLQLFLNDTKLPGISRVTPVDTEYLTLYNFTSLQPSFLYLNISQVEKSSIGLAFVEVTTGSALWISLLNKFPSLDSKCASLPAVSVCNGTSVCNAFTNAQSYEVSCLDMTDQSRCLQLKNEASLSADYVEKLIPAGESNQSHIICPPFNCEKVPPYMAIRNTQRTTESPGLNHFLSTRILNDVWAQQSGVCTNKYSNVYPYNPPAEPRTVPAEGPSKAEKSTMFLETNCISDVSGGNTTYCWLTGQYHSLTDRPGSPRKNLSRDLFSDPENMFVCYKVHKQRFEGWFITTFGVLIGWLGSVQLIFQMLLWIVKKVKRDQEERITSSKVSIKWHSNPMFFSEWAN